MLRRLRLKGRSAFWKSRAWRISRASLRTLRPVLLAALAAGGFALLLRWHHGNFERDMVNNFQHYQSQTANTTCDSIRRALSELTKNLQLAGAYPEAFSLDGRTMQAVDAGYDTYKDISRMVFAADANATILHCSPPDCRPDLENWPALKTTFEERSDGLDGVWFGRNDDGSAIQILVPIHSGDKLKGVVGSEVNLHNLLAQCLSRSEVTKRSKCWVIGPTGRVIYRGRGQIAATDEDSLRLEAKVTAMVRDKCIRRGLAEVAEVSDHHGSDGGLIVTCTPLILGENRYGLAIGHSKSGISVPLNSHERVIYALIGALGLLYFATGYLSFRSEKAHADLAEQRRRAAEAASRAKSDFLAKMSHEIRTPMHGIMGMTELVLESDVTAQQRRCLDLAKRSSEALLTVINDILDISKIEAGKFKLVFVPFNLRDCLSDTVDSFRPRAQAEGIDLSLHIDSAAPSMVVGDPGRLRQIVTNLVGNAMKFTSAGSVEIGVKVVSAGADDVRLGIEVVDTGVGISPERQTQIFDAFEQADGATSRKYGGTGLGLAISAQLVEMMCGTLAVESEPGKGSRFFFDIRLGLTDSGCPQDSEASMKALANMRAMVVDLDEANGVRMTHLLSTWQMKAVHVRSAGEAMDELARAAEVDQCYQLVILDAFLPEMDGFELARRIRELPRHGEIVLMMCAAGLRGDSDRCQELAIRAYLPKPVDPSALLRTITAAFANPTGRRLITRHWLRENFRRLQILLADDNEVNREHGTMLLERWGHEVRCACDGREAIDLLGETSFDLVLMDVQMPRMDGIAACKAIRVAEAGTDRHIPIIAMTADAMARTRDQCIQAGMDSYVSKPVQADKLLTVIEEVSTRHIAQDHGEDQDVQCAKVSGKEQAARATASPDQEEPVKACEQVGEAPDQSQPEQGAFDLARALNFSGGRRATLERLAGLFVEGLPALRADMRCALDAHEADTLRKATHRLRGSAALFGADSTCALAERLSDAAKSADWPCASGVLDELDRELARVTDALDALQKESCKTNRPAGKT